MAFPDALRVLYDNNPLQAVVCQLRFPPVLRIEAEIPAAFQDQIRAEYPFYELKSAVSLPPGLPPEVAQLIGAGQKTHDFTSKDRHWELMLNRDFISLTCHDYTRWEDFRQRLDDAVKVLVAHYQPSPFTRIGLLYQDVIHRSRLGLNGVPWNELLAPWVIGALGLAETLDEVEIYQAHTVLRLPEEEGKLQAGFWQASDPALNNEIVFVLNTDFFMEQQTEPSNALQCLDSLHQQAHRFFHCCITERLHQAMGPRPVSPI